MSTPFLTIEQAAERAQVSRSILKGWIREGLPVCRLSERILRIHVDTFDAWCRKNEGTVTSQAGSVEVFNLSLDPRKSTGYRQ